MMKMGELYNMIQDVAGSNVAIEVFKRFRGSFLSIHRRDCDLIKVIEDLGGNQAADVIHKKLKGQQIYIGRLEHLQLPDRNKRIREDKAAGASMNILSKKYDLSFMQIHNVVTKKCKH